MVLLQVGEQRLKIRIQSVDTQLEENPVKLGRKQKDVKTLNKLQRVNENDGWRRGTRRDDSR